jgi:hypothetical protein
VKFWRRDQGIQYLRSGDLVIGTAACILANLAILPVTALAMKVLIWSPAMMSTICCKSRRS